MPACPFCARIAQGEVTQANELAVAFPDGFPISPGHTLIVPRRHESDFFGLTDAEQAAMLNLVQSERIRLEREYSPQGDDPTRKKKGRKQPRTRVSSRFDSPRFIPVLEKR